MEFLWFILIGICAGWLATQFTRGASAGLLGNLVLGTIGALLGGFTFRLLGLAAYGLMGQLVVSTVGAILLIVLMRATRQGPRR